MLRMLELPNGQQTWVDVAPADWERRVAFHLENGTANHDPRLAERAAAAEILAQDAGIEIEWGKDWSVDHMREFDYQPTTCEAAIALDREGDVLASLGCIDDAEENYRRVVAAGLYWEALAQVHP